MVKEATAEDGTDEGASTAADDRSGPPLVVYEWGGGIIAGLGFFLSPLITTIPACYCVLKLQEERPQAANGILVLLLVTVLFWVLVLLFVFDYADVIVERL